MNLKKDVLPLLKETGQEFQKDEAGQLGAALAYYAMFSIFPLLLLLLAVLGFVLRNPDSVAVQNQILTTVAQNFSPQLSDTLKGIMDVVAKQAGAATGIGLVTLLLGASGVFQQLDITFNKIWRVPEKPKSSGIVETIMTALREKLFSFGMVLAVGFLLLVSLVLTGVTQALSGVLAGIPIVGGAFGFVVGLLMTVALSTLIFALLFKYLPHTDVRWGDVWLGALITAIIWEIAKHLLALYVEHSSYASAYGAIGTVLVLMVWVYFSSQVLFLGAEFTEVYARRHGSRAAQPAAPEQAPQPAAEPEPSPQPAPRPAPSTGTVAAATSAGLLVGVVGGAIAGAAALIIGARRAASSVTRRVKRVTR